ncbi:MAG TPA: hypothetical protein PL096_02995 [Micropepsaceae bacterium]|nr:hypothetical protein [Micropepsaceae bacterium]
MNRLQRPRIYGGINRRIDGTEGKLQGTTVGEAGFARAQGMFDGTGTAPPPTAMR